MPRRRGEIYTAATGSGYGGKPRPVLVLQSDAYGDLPRTIVALIASPTVEPPSYRILVDPTQANGLRDLSEIQPDMLQTVRWNKIGTYCGTLDATILARVDRALLELLGFNIR